MVATLFDPGIFSLMRIDGSISVGAKIAWYQTGTMTPVVTYSDRAATTPNPNPVVALANGRFPQIWLNAGSYKFIVTDADDTNPRSQDPYIVDPAAPTIAAALNAFLAGTAPLAIANGGTGQSSAINAIAALGGLPLAGGALTGNLTRDTKGGFAFHNTAAMANFEVFLTPTAAADPRTPPLAGKVWLRY